LSRESNGEHQDLGTVNPGEVFGEMGVSQNTTRYATATATWNCCLYQISEKQLLKESKGYQHPAVMVSRTLAQRICELNEKLETASAKEA